ncbi:hypothetical protein L798_10206 [Zootermopsis nevadensis]|uniref:Receptor ligand binding region domain-containing protein n=1 Tax=Zootermopsis nevadensis TaxID=136037 RepID=A0A067R5D5_ZOONE|nr:hypothetical protein L798_10206 [Zootermopsis nevadensis]
MLEAVRAMVLATHWHSFTVLADSESSSGVLLRRDLASILNTPPLNPTLLILRSGTAARHSIFRRLADISRSTRGVIVLICNLQTARQVTTEAKRLNMMSGHFVWLWIDTSASSTLVSATNIQFPTDNNSRSDPNTFNSTFDNPNAPEQSLRSRPRSSSSKRHERGSNDDKTQWDPSLSNNSKVVDGIFTTGNPEEVVRKPRDMDVTSGSAQDVKTFNVLSTNLSESGQPNFTDVLRPSGHKENFIGEPDINSNKDTFTNSASRKMGFNDLDFVLKSDESGTRNIKNVIKASDGVELLGQERISDIVNFRDNKLRSELVQSTRSDGWVYNENINDGSERFKVRLPGFNEQDLDDDVDEALPVGLLALRTQPMRLDRHLVKGAVRLVAETLLGVLTRCAAWMPAPPSSVNSCWTTPSESYRNFSDMFARELRTAVRESLVGRRESEVSGKVDRSLVASFDVLNLVQEKSATDNEGTLGLNEPEGESVAVSWKLVGEVVGRGVRLDTIVWPGGDLVVAGLSPRARSVFRIVTALAPPFVMEGELDEDGQCLRGLPCHRVLTSDKDNLTLVFNEMETNERLEEEELCILSTH